MLLGAKSYFHSSTSIDLISWESLTRFIFFAQFKACSFVTFSLKLNYIIGVLILSLEVISNYLRRGIPNVRLTPPCPAKWKVFKVIWVDGSPIDWAAVHPTASPGSIMSYLYFSEYTSLNYFESLLALRFL